MSALGELVELARERRPDDEVLPQFLRHYYRHLPDEDVDDRRLDDIYAAATTHLRLGRFRQPDELLVRVVSPDLDRDGWSTDRSILLFVTTDIPFLVDTVRMVLDRYGLGIHLLVHPILRVVRSNTTELTAVDSSTGEGDDIEAWTQIEIDRCPPDCRASLEVDVRTAIADVERVVADHDAMYSRLRRAAAGDPLVDWLADPHFVFLGAATYRRHGDRGEDLELVVGSELGAFRDGGSLDPNLIDPPTLPGDEVVTITRAATIAPIHRRARLTCIAVRPPGSDEAHRFVGLLGSAAYRNSVFTIPTVSERAQEVIDLVGSSLRSHTGRAVRNTIETLPRDLVFELDSHRLAHLVLGIVGLQERRIVRIFHVAEPVGPFTTVFVFVPRTRISSDLVGHVERLVGEWYGGEVSDTETFVGTSSLARITMSVRASEDPDVDRLADLIDEVSRTWDERVEAELIETLGEVEGRRVLSLVGPAVPSDYRARVQPAAAVADLAHVAALAELDDDDVRIATSLGRSLDADDGVLRFRVYLRGRSATMAELVPVLDHLGLHALAERPATFVCPAGTVHLYDIDVRPDTERITEDQYREVQATFVGLVTGTIEADGLNRLVLAAGLDRRQVAVLRLYHRYLHQLGFPFSATYIERSLIGQPAIARGLVELFDARFDPRRLGGPDAPERTAETDRLRRELASLLDAVPLLDDDRICRAFLSLIEATTRTTAFAGGDEIAVKLQPDRVAFVPEPRPAFEIFVCSPWVEGVHLRGGRIARGGLRWSDRPEDFRTEVLGLVKAQMVKNAVIVPVGAKGGFVVKRSSAPVGDRDAVRAEGVDRYRRFVRALLALTDDVVGGEVVHPVDCVVHDPPDPYLVVAADKGTATFSDIANELAVERGFWLGDAFASGGSNGYDHKAMGITARGAWESVRRHASVIGKDPDVDELSAVGIGDMSGDVFGNGMLLSRHLRLVAAFDHRHVFLDPDPDPAVSFDERRRLFALPRSSWADYDTSLISPGGGVYPRTAKSIPVTPEVRAVLDLDDVVTALRPDQLIAAVLRAPVDLLWNGGIGTYVKASTESNEDVGDRANDALRVDGAELRCRIVGEGGNLGLTQLARIEFALGGGLVNTDAIDNSAGVDCSDHEVNIKIALDQLVAAGDLTVKQRNELLEEMTDEVADLVLANNRAQTLALTIARRQGLPMVNVHARYLDLLEAEGLLDRRLEYLPSDKMIAERQAAGQGLTTPEFAVMIAYTKNVDVQEIIDADLPDDPVLADDLLAYFPAPLRERHRDALLAHPLRREIITTQLVNSMVNLSGISFDHRMTEGSGAALTDVAKAFVAARDVFGFEALWADVDELTGVDLDTRVDLYLDARRMVERSVIWLLRSRRPPLDVGGTIAAFRPGISLLAAELDEVVDGRVADDLERLAERRMRAGVPAPLAVRAARWPWLHTGFDIVELAAARALPILDAARTYWAVFEALELGWLWDGIGNLPRSDRWQTQARASLRDDLMSMITALAADVIDAAGGSTAAWIAANERAVGRTISMHTEIRRAESFDLTTLSVALRQLRNLTLTTADAAPFG